MVSKIILSSAELSTLSQVLQLIRFSLSAEGGNRKYCFVIGSGASVSSGIPTGAQLVDRWLQEIFEQRATGSEKENTDWRAWATEDNLGIKDFQFDRRASHYGSVFKLAFARDLDIGRRHLAQLMAGKAPSYGYSVLARILGYTGNQVVITTNFDHLIEESLGRFAYSDAKIIHDSYFSRYIGNYVSDPNPLVLKLHGDIYFNTYNTIDELSQFSDAWQHVFQDVFSKATPVFIGYGGHDLGFMASLAKVRPESIQGNPIWFYRSTPPENKTVKRFLKNSQGQLIKAPDFDELMLLLGSSFNITEAEKRHEIERDIDRAAWMRNFEHITQPIIKSQPKNKREKEYQSIIRSATSALLTTENTDGWWNWHYKAQLEKTYSKSKKVYTQGLVATNNNIVLQACYRSFGIRQKRGRSNALEELRSLYVEAGRAFGISNPETLTVAFQLARALESSGTKAAFHEADGLFTKVIQARQSQLSNRHPDTVASMEAYGNFLCNNKFFDRGIEFLRSATDLRKETTSEQHKLYRSSLAKLKTRQTESNEREKRFDAHRNMQRTLVIHQPHFLPWVGYFNKLANCSDFVALDTANFRQRYYQHRARLRDASGQTKWGTIRLDNTSIHQQLFECSVSKMAWKEDFLAKISEYYRKTPQFNSVYPALCEALSLNHLKLSKINISLIKWAAEYTDLPEIRIHEASDIQNTDEFHNSVELLQRQYDVNDARVARTVRVVAIMQSLGIRRLIMGEGGSMSAHDLELFRDNDIQLIQQSFRDREIRYRSYKTPFTSGLSIIDALFQEGRITTRKLIEKPWTSYE